MKISKKQLRRIIKEERARLQEQAGLPTSASRALQSMRYNFEEEINAQMSQVDRKWYQNDDIMLAIMEMLEDLKSQMEEFSRM